MGYANANPPYETTSKQQSSIIQEENHMSQDLSERKNIETLHGLVLTETTATIKVTSTGCTKKEDFQLRLQKSEPRFSK